MRGGLMIAGWESAELAEALIADTCDKHAIALGQLTLHADRGASMRSTPVADLLADLGVIKIHSRPYVSDDNPYSESHFKTMKYRSNFPDRFQSIEEARAFCQMFFAWYNYERRHSGIGYLTPAAMHAGVAGVVAAQPFPQRSGRDERPGLHPPPSAPPDTGTSGRRVSPSLKQRVTDAFPQLTCTRQPVSTAVPYCGQRARLPAFLQVFAPVPRHDKPQARQQDEGCKAGSDTDADVFRGDEDDSKHVQRQA
jgi:hypothetical protein